jgi:hypothetical protein
MVRFRATVAIYRLLKPLGYHDGVAIPAELHSMFHFYLSLHLTVIEQKGVANETDSVLFVTYTKHRVYLMAQKHLELTFDPKKRYSQCATDSVVYWLGDF